MPITTFLDGRPPTRGLLWLALSDTLIVQSRHVTSDVGGGGTLTWTNVGTTSCRIAPLTKRPETRLTGGQIDERSTHVVTAPVGTAARAGSRVAIAGRGTFEVTGVRQRTSELATTFEVIQLL